MVFYQEVEQIKTCLWSRFGEGCNFFTHMLVSTQPDGRWIIMNKATMEFTLVEKALFKHVDETSTLTEHAFRLHGPKGFDDQTFRDNRSPGWWAEHIWAHATTPSRFKDVLLHADS